MPPEYNTVMAELLKRFNFLKEYMEKKRTEITTLQGNLSDIESQIEQARYEMEWAMKEMEEVSKSIKDLKKE